MLKHNKRLFFTSVQLILAFAAFIVVSLSWFSISTSVSTVPLSFSIDSGIVQSYEIRYYTFENVYKFDKNTGSILVYDDQTSTWISPSYENPTYQNFNYQGIFINQYDPLIEQNNTYNQLVIELYITYDVTEDTSMVIDLRSDISLANHAINEFGYLSSRPYYFSEVSYIQFMSNSNYNNVLEGDNIFLDLQNNFNETDVNENLLYPRIDFYDELDQYNTQTQVESINLLANETNPEIYLYFNFTYNINRIENFIASENINITLDGSQNITFFQDIVIELKKGDLV